MKKRTKIIIFGIIIVGVIFLAYKYFSGEDANNQNITNGKNVEISEIDAEVIKKDFFASIDVKGTTKLTNEQKLRFNTAGTITAVNIKNGDEVKKGDVLATIESTDATTGIERARIDVENAQEELDSFVEDTNKTGVAKANLSLKTKNIEIEQKNIEIEYLKQKNKKNLEDLEIALKQAKNNLIIHKRETEKNISELNYNSEDREKILLEKAQQFKKEFLEYETEKNNFEKRLEKKLNEYYLKLKTTFSDIENEKISLKNELDEIGKLVGIGDKKSERVDYKNYFSGKNSVYKGEIKGKLWESIEKFKSLQKTLENIKDKKDKEEIIKLLKSEKDFYESYYKLSNLVALGYQNSVSTFDFNPESYAGNYIGKASSANSKIESISTKIHDFKTIDTISKIRKDLENDLEDKRISLENLKLQIKKLKDNQNYIVDTSNGNIEEERLKIKKEENSLFLQELELENTRKNQEKELELAKIGLENLKIDKINLEKERNELLILGENTQYKLKLNSLKTARENYKKTLKDLDNYKLIAPFDGKISKVDITTGDRINADTEVYISVVNPNAIEVNTSINQADIISVKQGMQARIKMNSYPGKEFLGTISNVDTTPNEENGVVKFKVKILLEKPKGIDIYSGLNAQVSIITKNIKDALVVPFTSINKDENGQSYVKVIKKDGTKEKRIVELGYTNGEFYEIKKGLEKGEKVVEIDYGEVSSNSLKSLGDSNETGDYVDVGDM